MANEIGVPGAEKIATALTINNTLKELNLGVSLRKICAQISRFSQKIINSKGNQILKEGVKMVGEALKINNTLTTLHLMVWK